MRESFQLIPLCELASLRIGGTPSRDDPSFWAEGDSGYRWAAISDLRGKYLDHTAETITAQGARDARLQIVPAGIPIMSFKLSLGRAAIPRRPTYTNEAIVAMTPKEGRADASWLYYAVPEITRRAVSETAIKGPTLNLAKLQTIQVPTPPDVTEQRRIAEILDTLDREIHEIEQIVDKYEHLRVGTIRAAMSDGLSLLMDAEASELVSTRVNVRGAWEIVPLGRLLMEIDAGHSPDLEDVPAGPGEWGVLKVSAIGKDGFHPEENKVARDRSFKRAALCVRPGDLLITRANTSQLVGLSCIVEDISAGLMLSDKTLRLRVDERSTPAEFINLVLGVAEVRRQIEIAATGTSGSMKNISQGAIKRLMIPWAPQEVTTEIIHCNDAFKDQIKALRQGARKLRLLKQGLMHDLLTGQVRVPVLSAGHRGLVDVYGTRP
jgi:type I restriction enzyme S subunit